jgi:hypothetical protein
MSALRSSITRALLPLCTMVLAVSACSDSMGPSSGAGHAIRDDGPSTTPRDTLASAPRDQPPAPLRDTTAAMTAQLTPKPSLLTQTGYWVKPPVLRPGYLAVTSQTVCISKPTLGKSVTVGTVQVTNLPDWEDGQALAWQKVMVRTLLWRWNSTLRTWQTVRYQDWWSPNQANVFGINWMTVPTAGFTNLSAGYYTVTVEARWYPFQVLMAYRAYSLNARSDYIALGNSQAFDGGSCYLQ